MSLRERLARDKQARQEKIKARIDRHNAKPTKVVYLSIPSFLNKAHTETMAYLYGRMFSVKNFLVMDEEIYNDIGCSLNLAYLLGSAEEKAKLRGDLETARAIANRYAATSEWTVTQEEADILHDCLPLFEDILSRNSTKQVSEAYNYLVANQRQGRLRLDNYHANNSA